MGTEFAYLGGVIEGQQVLRRLLAAGWRPDVIVALDDAAVGRASGGRPWAQSEWPGIRLLKVPAFQDVNTLIELGRSQVSGVLAVGVSEIFRPAFLASFPRGVYGFHASLLPELAGAAPANWALLQGRRKTGSTLLKYSADIDGGSIIAQAELPLDESVYVGELYRQISELSAKLWLSAWPRLQRSEIPDAPQGRLQLNLRRRPEDGVIRWRAMNAALLSRQIRALSDPYPGAHFWVDGRRLWVHRVEIEPGQATPSPTLLHVSDGEIVVGLEGGRARLSDLRLDNGEPSDGSALRGYVGRAMGELHQGKRVLAVVAHPDDEVLGVGGALAGHFKRGDDVYVRIVCTGRSVRYKEGEQDQLADARAAAHFLGSETKGLGFLDQQLDSGSNLPLIRAVEAEVQAIKPDIVFTHFWGDVNADHVRIAEAVDIAVRPYGAPFVKQVMAFETPSSTEWNFASRSSPFRPNRYINIAAELDRKLDAMRMYRSEIRPYPHPRSIRALREKAATRGSEAGFASAEAFVVLRDLSQ